MSPTGCFLTGKLTFLPVLLLFQMQNWLFCFQKSVALVLTHLMHNNERRSPIDAARPKYAQPSPEKGQLPPGRGSEASNGWRGPQSLHPNAGMLSNEEVYAAFRRNAERGDGHAAKDRFEFRHSDGVDSPSKLPGGSSAIPIQPHGPPAGHGQAAQGHGHPRSRAHSNQGRSLRSTSRDGGGYSASGSRTQSVDKMATSFKEDDDEHMRLSNLLHTPSDGSRTPESEGQRSDASDSGGEGDWHSRPSNEMPDDDEE